MVNVGFIYTSSQLRTHWPCNIHIAVISVTVFGLFELKQICLRFFCLFITTCPDINNKKKKQRQKYDDKNYGKKYEK